MNKQIYLSGRTLQNRKGFTLIELLAVIVILAIIAIIATPIVLNIIKDSQKTAKLRSADNYLSTVEKSVASALLEGNKVKNGTYRIMSDGNICTGTFLNNNCDGYILKIDISGEKPKSGKVVIKSKVVETAKLKYDTNTILKSESGELVIHNLIYDLGDIVTFDPGDGVNTTWYVVGEDNETVTLLLNKNIGNATEWVTLSDRNSTNDDGIGESSSSNCNNGNCVYSYTDEGPITLIDDLYDLTKDWNVEPIDNYTYVNTTEENEYDYQKLEIKDGTLSIYDQSGNKLSVEGSLKARLLSFEEIMRISSEFNENLTEEKITKVLNINIGLVNLMFDTTVSSIDEMLESLNLVNQSYKAKFFILLNLTAEGLVTYDLTLPDWLFENLNLDSYPKGYWLLSSIVGTSYSIFLEDGILNSRLLFPADTYSENIGIRPVIQIEKGKIGK